MFIQVVDGVWGNFGSLLKEVRGRRKVGLPAVFSSSELEVCDITLSFDW